MDDAAVEALAKVLKALDYATDLSGVTKYERMARAALAHLAQQPPARGEEMEHTCQKHPTSVSLVICNSCDDLRHGDDECDAERLRAELIDAGYLHLADEQTVRHLEREVARLREEIARLTDETEERAFDLVAAKEEIERLKVRRDDSERPKCLYCAFGETGQAATHEELAHHIEHECQRHPMARLRERNAALVAALKWIKGYADARNYDGRNSAKWQDIWTSAHQALLAAEPGAPEKTDG